MTQANEIQLPLFHCSCQGQWSDSVFSSTMSHSYRPANSHSFGLRLKQMPNLKSGFRVRKSEKIAPILTSFTHKKIAPFLNITQLLLSHLRRVWGLQVCTVSKSADCFITTKNFSIQFRNTPHPISLLNFFASICLGTLSSGTIYNDSGPQWNTPPPFHQGAIEFYYSLISLLRPRAVEWFSLFLLWVTVSKSANVLQLSKTFQSS